jgi:enamine deaminase RidA (YjgF/YER057c/UK114 family)
VDGVPAQGSGFSGLFIHAVVPHNECSRPELVFDGNTAVGRKWRSSVAEFLLIQNIGADFKATDSPTVQAENAFECMHRQIVSSGFSFQEVVRTWFYLTDILSWYGDFNKVRSASYRTCGIMPLPGQDVGLPSSTGIGCSHSNGRALAADVLLVRMQNGRRPNRIQNPAQKEAYKYGAAFSRAVEIKDRDSSLIEMSGTAAIDELGVSLYPNDAEAQINCTLDKIDVLLRRVGGTLQDIAQATVFVKHPDIALTFERIKAARGMKNFPSIIVHADICRAELLFEIDAEASVL